MGTGGTESERQLKRVCELWQPVTWSSKDTDQTIEEAKINNAKWDAFCSQFKTKK